MKKDSGQDYYQISIRFSPEESEIIQQLATKHGRSFNREVLNLVSAQLAQEERESVVTDSLERVNTP